MSKKRVKVSKTKTMPVIPFSERQSLFSELLGQKVKITTAHTTFVYVEGKYKGEAPYIVVRHGTIKTDRRGNPVFVEFGKRKPFSFLDRPVVKVKPWKRKK